MQIEHSFTHSRVLNMSILEFQASNMVSELTPPEASTALSRLRPAVSTAPHRVGTARSPVRSDRSATALCPPTKSRTLARNGWTNRCRTNLETPAVQPGFRVPNAPNVPISFPHRHHFRHFCDFRPSGIAIHLICEGMVTPARVPPRICPNQCRASLADSTAPA